jgi:ADP-heptose:LPS heptosyltransferase
MRIDDFAAAPTFPEWSTTQASRILAAIPEKLRVLAVHAETAARKMWSFGKFIESLDLFLARHREFVALVLQRKPLPLDAGLQNGRVFLSSGLPLGTAMSLTASSHLFLGVDSCMLHVADLSKIPGVGLFGPTVREVVGALEELLEARACVAGEIDS